MLLLCAGVNPTLCGLSVVVLEHVAVSCKKVRASSVCKGGCFYGAASEL